MAIWLIQGLLRQSFNCQTVLGYIREAHSIAATDLAEQAWLAKDLGTVRAELRALQHKASDLRTMLTDTQLQVTAAAPLPQLELEDIEEICPEGPEDYQTQLEAASAQSTPPEQQIEKTLKYILCNNFLGRVHTLDPTWPTRTLCGWRYSMKDGHEITDSPFGNIIINKHSEHISPRCGTCVKREEERFL